MQLADYRPVLEAAGFTVEAYEQPMNWQRQQRALVEGIIASEPELTKDVGTASAAGLLAMARGVLSDLHERRYVFGVARKGN